jgi:hypothetical protein
VWLVGWENRERGGPYYTRSRRTEGRVVREYVGAGLVGRLSAEADLIKRERVEAEKVRHKRELERLEALVSPAAELSEAAEVLVRAEFLAGGYHKHKGEWRRERNT